MASASLGSPDKEKRMTIAAKTASAGGEIVTVSGEITSFPGRYLISSGRNHFVSDAKPSSGGPGEAVQAGELLLSALASCSLSVIQKYAGEIGVRLRSAQSRVSFKRDPNDVSRYEYIRLQVRLEGVDRRVGHELLKQFTDTCPIYNTLRRGGTVEAELETDAIAA
jgi:uncharacterized OsmC-like protein